MALSFSFPSGKVKKGDSFASGESNEGKPCAKYPENENSSKGPSSWKSFPSLSFFKDSSSTGNSGGNVVKVPASSSNIISKLPIRTFIIGSNSKLSGGRGNSITSEVPKKAEKKAGPSSQLRLENLRGSTVNKSLPDVTDTESPKPLITYPSEKPCDLLAQIESLGPFSQAFQNTEEGVYGHVESKRDGPRGSSKADMDGKGHVSRSFDDNGNPCAPLQPQEGDDDHDQDGVKVEEDQAEESDTTDFEGDSHDGHGPSHHAPHSHSQSQSEESNMNRSISESSSNIISKETHSYEYETESKSTNPEEPRYFIDAAALSEDTTFTPFPDPVSPSPCTSTNFAAMTYEQDCTLPKQKSEESTTKKSDKEITDKPSTDNKRGNEVKVKPTVRSRVPVSKSYPDIIQTTFSNEEKDIVLMSTRPMAKENSDLDSLVADSLENLAISPSVSVPPSEKVSNIPKPQPRQIKPEAVPDKPLKAFEKPLNTSSGQMSGSSIMSGSMMTESQMGGLFAEKPPEAWVIDFNSLSMDSELESSGVHDSSRKSNNGSNSNSLAFFVNMDDQEKHESGVSRERLNSGESMSGPEKKIFSMFVDMNEGPATASGSSNHTIAQQNRKIPVVNKHVMNIMETSGSSGKSMNRKYPSPIFQHKAAAEAARKAARMEWEKQREKYFDSLEPTSLLMMPNMNMSTLAGSKEQNNDKGRMGESISSNRSSLHVANVLDSSFSSSFISSMETSQPEELETCQGGPCLKLGMDLLRMFQEGINTDVNINVNGKWIKAHKCILASRSQYFAAILSGHWVEKAGNTINLDGFSYSVVQFTLYHIYSGTNEIPDTIDLLELATLTDLLGLEGLRENISQTFRVKFCHNFHRPCTGCITGVLECFPIAATYGMDDLHRKMIKWICKHFVRIWPTKGFASLGDELTEKCLRYSVNHLSTDNILDHTLGCDQLSTTMPNLRWTEPIFSLVNQLAEECVQFLGQHLSDVLQSQKFLQFGKGQAWNISRIEGTFVKAMDLLTPDVACLSHTALTRLIELGTETIDEVEWSTSFVDFLKMLRDYVERFLLANASKAVLSRCWEQLSPDFKKKVCSTSFVGYDKFGNKIVKNTGGSGTSHASGATTKTKTSRPSSSSSSRTSGAVSVTSRNPLSKQTSAPTKPIQTVAASVVTKVASVRPLQSQQSNVHPTSSTNTVPLKRSSVPGRPTSSGNKSGSGYEYETQSSPPTATPRSASNLRTVPKAVDREKSFNSRRASISTASSTASVNRTPIKPLTPSVPSKPSPLTAGYDQGPPSSSTTPRTTKSAGRNQAHKAQKPPEPPKKTFISNSAKAAAVSKPILKPASKRTPTQSVSSVNSQPTPTNTVPRSANVSQSSRYLSTANTRSEGFSARSSFSNIERPQTVKSKVDCNPPRRNTYGQAQGQASNVSKITRRPASGTSVVVKPNNSRQNDLSGYSSMPHALPPVTSAADFASLSDSYSRENIMSRSTVETESGEVKMRTLAEIGRSSTFSKDEPTILGKMDGSGYGNLDYDEYDS